MPQSQQQTIDTSPFKEVQWVAKRVLLASSDEAFLARMNGFLAAEGMRVSVFRTASEALVRFKPELYDLLVIDAQMEGDGLALGHRIKLGMQNDFVPLLFVTALTDELSLASCFEAGGDDLVSKSYSEMLVFARINALLKMGDLYRQQYREREELSYYHAMMEKEQQLAKSIFSSIVHQDYLGRNNIQYTLSPMSIFNGDMLLAASTPDGHEYILLGDFTGHGLTASVGTLPVSQIFYAMTAKGFGLGTIIGEINKSLRKLLPVGMFMATYAIDINQQEHVMSAWGGGIPDLLLRRSNKDSLEHISAKNLPLGIVDTVELDLQMEIIPIQAGDRFYIYTDGITESENRDGKMFGTQALHQVISGSSCEQNIFSAVMTALDEFRAGHEQSDDITMLEYTYMPARLDKLYETVPVACDTGNINTNWNISLTLDPHAIRNFDPHPLLTQLIVDLQGLKSYRPQLYTILSELFSNAVDYGLLGMQSSVKSGEDGIRLYAEERQKRLDELIAGHIIISLENIPDEKGRGILRLSVEDSGQGFDYRKLAKAPGDGAATGLQLVRLMSDGIEFEGAGNKVTARCRWHCPNA